MCSFMKKHDLYGPLLSLASWFQIRNSKCQFFTIRNLLSIRDKSRSDPTQQPRSSIKLEVPTIRPLTPPHMVIKSHKHDKNTETLLTMDYKLQIVQVTEVAVTKHPLFTSTLVVITLSLSLSPNAFPWVEFTSCFQSHCAIQSPHTPLHSILLWDQQREWGGSLES